MAKGTIVVIGIVVLAILGAAVLAHAGPTPGEAGGLYHQEQSLRLQPVSLPIR